MHSVAVATQMIIFAAFRPFYTLAPLGTTSTFSQPKTGNLDSPFRWLYHRLVSFIINIPIALLTFPFLIYLGGPKFGILQESVGKTCGRRTFALSLLRVSYSPSPSVSMTQTDLFP